MDNLLATLSPIFGDYMEQFLYLSVFLFATSIVMGIAIWLLSGAHPVDRRLGEIAEGNRKKNKETRTEGSFTVRWVEPFAKLVEPAEGWEKSLLRRRLVRAGIREKSAIYYYLAGKFAGAFIIAMLVLLPYLFYPPARMTPPILISLVVLMGLIGMYLPDFYLSHRAEKRQLAFQEGFPDAMDMLVVCVEAGLGLDAAIQRVGKELYTSHPELSDEMRLVSLELRAGKGRAEALRSLAERIQLDDVRALTSILIQAEHFGTSVAEALRQQADEMRTLRIQRAKERAAKLPVKLIFPIMFFIFPALFLVVLGPAIVRIYVTLIQGGL